MPISCGVNGAAPFPINGWANHPVNTTKAMLALKVAACEVAELGVPDGGK